MISPNSSPSPLPYQLMPLSSPPTIHLPSPLLHTDRGSPPLPFSHWTLLISLLPPLLPEPLNRWPTMGVADDFTCRFRPSTGRVIVGPPSPQIPTHYWHCGPFLRLQSNTGEQRDKIFSHRPSPSTYHRLAAIFTQWRCCYRRCLPTNPSHASHSRSSTVGSLGRSAVRRIKENREVAEEEEEEEEKEVGPPRDPSHLEVW